MTICEILSLLIIFRFYNCLVLKNLEQSKCPIDNNDDDDVDHYNCSITFLKSTPTMYTCTYIWKRKWKKIVN